MLISNLELIRTRFLTLRDFVVSHNRPQITFDVVHVVLVMFMIEKIDRPLHAITGIMGNQGKFTKKQSCKTYVFLYISVLISYLETKHAL